MQHFEKLKKPIAKSKSPSRAMSTEPIVSHGRGGAGNIEPDGNVYVDGEIVREGPVGDQGDGAYSTGRGGAGNIDSPSMKPKVHGPPGDHDVIPEPAIKRAQQENYHVGRGGEGNVHKDHAKDHKEQGGVMKKVEHLFGKKEGEGK